VGAIHQKRRSFHETACRHRFVDLMPVPARGARPESSLKRSKNGAGMFGLWRPRANGRNVLLWWGSFHAREHLTISDAHGVQNLSERLDAAGFRHCILSRSSWTFGSAPTVRSIRQLPERLDSLIFVCGLSASIFIDHEPLLRRVEVVSRRWWK
jgi:hypothetical protein